MSVPESRNLPLEEGITEVEFSADDVANLPRPRDSASPSPREGHAPAARAPVARSAKTAKAAGRSGARAWQLPAVVAAAAVTALAGVGYLYAFAGKQTAPPPLASLELTDPDPVVPSVKKLTPVGSIVRVRNPFDRHEVFEFPAGTSKAEARDAVAKLLMDRAMERRSLYTSTSLPKRRKPG
jgi:hypothetical protein